MCRVDMVLTLAVAALLLNIKAKNLSYKVALNKKTSLKATKEEMALHWLWNDSGLFLHNFRDWKITFASKKIPDCFLLTNIQSIKCNSVDNL